MQKVKTSRKTLTQNVNIRTDARTDERMERRKLYTLDILRMPGYNNEKSTCLAFFK